MIVNAVPYFADTGPFHEIVEIYQWLAVGVELFHHASIETLSKQSPVCMAATVQNDLCIEPSKVKNTFAQEGSDVQSLNRALMRLLGNWAYERAQKAYSPKEWKGLKIDHPELEYLRHVRNASSHKEGRWQFRPGEPKQPAAWRGKQLSNNLDGQSMWQTQLATGDILILLSDVDGILVANPPSGGW